MDMKKSSSTRQQYGRLKGATKILSDPNNCVASEEPDKRPERMDVVLDDNSSTTTSAFVYENSTINLNNNAGCRTTAAGATNMLHQFGGDSVVAPPPPVPQKPDAASTSTTQSSSSSGLAQPAPLLASTMTQTSSTSTSNLNNTGNSTHLFRCPPQQFMPDIRSLFECPICFDYAVPPIYQCQNGHLVCQCCSTKITHCPTCRVPITEPSIRNLQLDRLANTFQFPCKYDYNGCPWKSYWYKKREHEECCEFISYSCPCPGTACKWTGLLSQVMSHLNEHHKSITTLSGEDIVFLATDINLKGAVDWVMIQSCFNHHFLLVLEKQELKNGQQQFFAIVQLIGSQKEADNFRYKLELSNNHSGQITKRLQWDATPRSILEGIHSAISTYDCLVFDARMAQHFLSPIQKDKDSASQGNDSQGQNLGINVTIDRIL